MKKTLLSLVACAFSMSLSAQDINVTEPEFVNGFYHVTSSNTFTSIPKESCSIKKHKDKSDALAKTGKTAGGISGLHDTFLREGNPTVKPYKTETVLRSKESITTIDALLELKDMDIVVEGVNSSYIVPEKQDLNILYKDVSNENDISRVMRIVKFNKGNKNRTISCAELSTSAINSSNKSGNYYLPFDAHKYGEQSYLIQVPGYLLEKGEYGIVIINQSKVVTSEFMATPVNNYNKTTPNISSNLTIATFSIQ